MNNFIDFIHLQEATCNSNDIVNINKNNLLKIRLDTKATNIIGVKKGPKFGVKLSHDEMKVCKLK